MQFTLHEKRKAVIFGVYYVFFVLRPLRVPTPRRTFFTVSRKTCWISNGTRYIVLSPLDKRISQIWFYHPSFVMLRFTKHSPWRNNAQRPGQMQIREERNGFLCNWRWRFGSKTGKGILSHITVYLTVCFRFSNDDWIFLPSGRLERYFVSKIVSNKLLFSDIITCPTSGAKNVVVSAS